MFLVASFALSRRTSSMPPIFGMLRSSRIRSGGVRRLGAVRQRVAQDVVERVLAVAHPRNVVRDAAVPRHARASSASAGESSTRRMEIRSRCLIASRPDGRHYRCWQLTTACKRSEPRVCPRTASAGGGAERAEKPCEKNRGVSIGAECYGRMPPGSRSAERRSRTTRLQVADSQARARSSAG